jgi:hypothetical protein
MWHNILHKIDLTDRIHPKLPDFPPLKSENRDPQRTYS